MKNLIIAAMVALVLGIMPTSGVADPRHKTETRQHTGPMGPAGPQGIPGAAGLDGINGTNGLDGATGAIGPMGPTGPMGGIGPQGIQGIQGFTGPMGPQGNPGTNGTSPTVAVEPAGINCEFGGAVISDSLGNTAYICGAAPVLPPPAPVATKVGDIWPCSNGGARPSNVIGVRDVHNLSGWGSIAVNGPLEAWSDGTVRIAGYTLVKEADYVSQSGLAYYDLQMADGAMSCTSRVLPATWPYSFDPTSTANDRFVWTNCAFKPCNGAVDYVAWPITP
jgi:hypothetical protein